MPVHQLERTMGRKPSKEAITTPFTIWLTDSRARRGWTQDLLAEKAGIDSGYVSMLERGQRRPSRKRAETIAMALWPNNPEMVNSGLTAAGFATTTPESSVELVPLTPEERAIIEQIRAMSAPKASASEFDLEPRQIGGRLPTVKFPDEHAGMAPAEEDRERQRRD